MAAFVHDPNKCYLVDYYAVLGVSREATLEEIKKAHRAKLTLYHSDRFQGLAPELAQRAEEATRFLNDAYEVLSDEEARLQYDLILRGWDKAISTDGREVIDISHPGFSMTLLLEGLNADPEERLRQVEQIALQFSNFNPATYKYFCTLAETEGRIPAPLRAAYAEQLAARDLYLSLKEGMLMEGVGYRNYEVVPRLSYTDQVADTLAEITTKAEAGVTHQVLLLTTGQIALLAPPEGGVVENQAGILLEKYRADITLHLEREAVVLKALAEEREKIIRTRFDLLAEITYHPAQTIYTPKLLVRVVAGERSEWFAFECDMEKTRVSQLELEGINQVGDEVVAREFLEQGFSIVSFKLVSDIDLKDQLIEVVQCHIEHLSAAADSVL